MSMLSCEVEVKADIVVRKGGNVKECKQCYTLVKAKVSSRQEYEFYHP